MNEDSFYRQIIRDSLGYETRIRRISRPSGGCINYAVTLDTDHGRFFIKYNNDIPADMFKKEASGLSTLKQTGAIRVPEPLGYGRIDSFEYLLLEYIDQGKPHSDFWQEFGVSLARLHKMNSSLVFGLEYDNYIGKLLQRNAANNNWIDFFIENRLEFQLKIATERNLITDSLYNRFRQLYKKLPELLPAASPSLIHGDLWSENFIIDNNGSVVLLDPAIYYGNREAELAFTRMFGGFSEIFYDAYDEFWPLEKEFNHRVGIYNLYPGLVHLNMFGNMYLGGINETIGQLA